MSIIKDDIIKIKTGEIKYDLGKIFNCTHSQIYKVISKLEACTTLEEANDFDSVNELILEIGGTGLPLEKQKLKAIKTEELKEKLASTDYQALKYLERWITEENYGAIKTERQILRDEINRIEREIDACTTLEELNNYN